MQLQRGLMAEHRPQMLLGLLQGRAAMQAQSRLMVVLQRMQLQHLQGTPGAWAPSEPHG